MPELDPTYLKIFFLHVKPFYCQSVENIADKYVQIPILPIFSVYSERLCQSQDINNRIQKCFWTPFARSKTCY